MVHSTANFSKHLHCEPSGEQVSVLSNMNPTPTWQAATIVERRHLDNGRRIIEVDSTGTAWELSRLSREKSSLGTTSLYQLVGEYVEKPKSSSRKGRSNSNTKAARLAELESMFI